MLGSHQQFFVYIGSTEPKAPLGRALISFMKERGRKWLLKMFM